MKKALLVIDVQNEYFSGPMTITYPEDSYSNILKAMDAATSAEIPVVVVQTAVPEDSPNKQFFQRGTHGWELTTEVAARPRQLLVDKLLPGSFTGTNLEEWLRDNEIDTLTISGYMTQMCCDTTSRQAVHLGFKVEFLSDATGTLALSNSAGNVTAEELHRAVLVVQQSRFASVMSTQEWISNL